MSIPRANPPRRSLSRRFYQFIFTVSSLLSRAPSAAVRPDEILILTASTPEIDDYAVISAENKRLYAARHGYAFLWKRDGFDPTRPPAWSKIRFIEQALKTHRVVFWTDADALIMNPDLKIEALLAAGASVHLTRMTTPFPHLNTGHMIFRATPFSRIFLKAVWRMTAFINDASWEQRAINHLCDAYRLTGVHISPNRRFNSCSHVPGDPDPYQTGDFIIHFPGVPGKAALIARYAALAVPPSPISA